MTYQIFNISPRKTYDIFVYLTLDVDFKSVIRFKPDGHSVNVYDCTLSQF